MKREMIDRLVALNACQEGIAFVQRYDTPQLAWDACERPKWMIWWLRRQPGLTPQLVELAATFVERALPIWERFYPQDRRPHMAINAARTWAITYAEAARAWAANVATWAAVMAANPEVERKWQCDEIRRIFPTPPGVE